EHIARFRLRISVGVLNIVLIAGGLLILSGVLIAGPQGGTADWAPVQGQVISSQVVSTWDWQGSQLVQFYYPDVQYGYTVSGVSYNNHTVSPGIARSTDSTLAESLVSKYPANAQVTVYYDPSAPQKAVLEKGGSILGLIPLLMGAALTAYSALGLRRRLRGMPREPDLAEGQFGAESGKTLLVTGITVAIVGGVGALGGLVSNDTLLIIAGAIVTIAGAGWGAFVYRRTQAPAVMATEAQPQTAQLEAKPDRQAEKMAIDVANLESRLPRTLSDHLGKFGVDSRALEKKSAEVIVHRSTDGSLSDPVVGSVRVDGKRFDQVEVWRVKGDARGDYENGNWYLYWYIFIVKVQTRSRAKEFEADLSWTEGLNSELGQIDWVGGELCRALKTDSALTDLLLALGMPNVHVGRPKIGSTPALSNARLGYVGIQFSLRVETLNKDGQPLERRITYSKDNLPLREEIEAADRIARHVRDLAIKYAM
ncbi:MAG TPA: DUF3592 domain-containing protein, partial [Methanomassiliicoccales archaeon]|nr:DUF3592 domain-containing protein [Methanomassiliicoccales archaeon]